MESSRLDDLVFAEWLQRSSLLLPRLKRCAWSNQLAKLTREEVEGEGNVKEGRKMVDRSILEAWPSLLCHLEHPSLANVL